MKRLMITIVAFIFCFNTEGQNLLFNSNSPTNFPIVSAKGIASIVFDNADDSLVQISARLLQEDIERVSGNTPGLYTEVPGRNIIVIGSLKSVFIQKLVKEKKLKVDSIKGKWEAYQIQIIKSPFKGVDQALVIVGSDRRGTAFGVFELSKHMGVSPWYWWADVPVHKHEEIFVKANTFITDAPKVQYRGIFINDEAPALSGWSKEKFGGFNHLFYAKVFELMLRLKANYIWPAMWGNAFYDDDSLNIKTADKYGIVIGTSHHEPLMRAHDEWRRYGQGKWNYDSNAVRLRQFWKEGMQRATNEKIVSIGMRGDGDEPMSRETATELLEHIVKDQRKIIEEVTAKPASQTPQLWALYKEVQDYYDKGMRVPDDVTLLLCDDNWGNIRKLPNLNEPKRKGGYGIYYHFDYVGGPRNYKWINTNNIARVWEQMHLAWEHDVKKIWIVNVGDIKPMELPISFFLDFAWDPTKWNEDNLQDYYTQWAGQQFGDTYAKETGEILQQYSSYASRRKPELLDEKTYSLPNFYEADRVIRDWRKLEKQAKHIDSLLINEYKDAFFQLVLHPIEAFGNLHEMYYAIAKNRRLAGTKFKSLNVWADKAKEHFVNDSLLTIKYNTLADGKWSHMMDQTHIGYTYWQQPPNNKMPAVQYLPEEMLKPDPPVTWPDVAMSIIPENASARSFYEEEGYVSMQASHWTKAFNTTLIKWKVIPGIGRDGGGVTTFPVTEKITPLTSSLPPHVEYEFYTYDSGRFTANLYFSPTLNFHNAPEGLQFAVSVDDEEPQVISLNKDDNDPKEWNKWVANNIIIKSSQHLIRKPGKHVLRYQMISPGIVLQKLVLDFGGVKASYLGPPETLKGK